jgi:glutamate-ammonia-ligase adenylyltransferase
MSIPDHLIRDLPDVDAVVQFARRFEEIQPTHYRKLLKNDALLSDVLTLVSFSPLLATTLLQNPEYIWWLNRRRNDKGVRGKEELLESLARFSLTNSTVDDQIVFARFRRRELLRIYLADIRRQLTIAEITEELSNLADAILEFALRITRQELDNRFGSPQEVGERGREKPSKFCIVTLGKLGSKELNYSSDIDLLFIYSDEGTTTGTGSRGKVTNREYFAKLAELIAKLIGRQTGEGATYRVDLRLRPHGRVGPLAMSVADTVRYYQTEAADWERQVLIRSRSGGGDADLFASMFRQVEQYVFSESQSIASALQSVRRSKQKIDLEHINDKGYDVKLGKGGIREIEFIAQALQLAYGGRDRWLRASHTLVSLGRLADRLLIEHRELSQLYEGYEFLRRLEHNLQMENGLQTHLVPNDAIRRALVARRMRFSNTEEFDAALESYTANVHGIFRRILSDQNIGSADLASSRTDGSVDNDDIIDVDLVGSQDQPRGDSPLETLRDLSPRFAAIISALGDEVEVRHLDVPIEGLRDSIRTASDMGSKLAAMRSEWQRQLTTIAALDAAKIIDVGESKRRQTVLAEASIDVALDIARSEMEKRTGARLPKLGLAVLGVGKLGGAGIDYDSDLDLVLVYDDVEGSVVEGLTNQEFYSRTAEIFVNALSGYTREGNLYRVDLRLRPHGSNGPNVISRQSFEVYMRDTAAIWELLAFVKLRAAHGSELAQNVESSIRTVVHERAGKISKQELAVEARRVRLMLEKQRSSPRSSPVNIKYGSGGMLDIYFAIRFLQLRDNVPDTDDSRSSDAMLCRLFEGGSLTESEFSSLIAGYRFLSSLDHAMRLIIGRSHVVPHAGKPLIRKIVQWLDLASVSDLESQLALYRIGIREAFDSVTSEKSF